MSTLTPDQRAMLAAWQQHTYAEFVLTDADAALATVTENPLRVPHFFRDGDLVCGARAAAISFGKNMTVYEEYLELLHAA
jgi:hypothetical protein